MTMHLDDLAAQVRASLYEAEVRLDELLAQRTQLRADIKVCRENLVQLTKLVKAVTPKNQNGPHE